jgi:hypothetical protein
MLVYQRVYIGSTSFFWGSKSAGRFGVSSGSVQKEIGAWAWKMAG